VGVLATPFVIGAGGIFNAETSVTAMHQIWSQVVGLLVITAWSGGISALLFYSLKLNKKLRLPEEIEIKGVDIIKHGESTYPAEAWQELQYGNGDAALSLPPVMKSNPSSRKTSVETMTGERGPGLGGTELAVKPLTFRKLHTENLDNNELQGITNNGFEHSVDWRDGRNLEETVFQNDVDQEHFKSKMKSRLVDKVVEQDRTLEFNDSKESTMI